MILKMLYERNKISNLVRKYRDEPRLDNKMALELDAILEEVIYCCCFTT